MSDSETNIDKIKLEDIVKILKKKFILEKMERFFLVNNEFAYQDKTMAFSFNEQNSILLEFKTLNENEKYKLLLALSLCEEEKFDHQIQNELREIKDSCNLDKIILWSKKKLPVHTLQSIKECADIIYIGDSEINQINYISNFFPMESSDYSYAVAVNKLTDLLIKRLKKLFHLVLSEIAASSYDAEYGKNKIATKAIMNFEEEKLNTLVKEIIASTINEIITLSSENKSQKKADGLKTSLEKRKHGIVVDVGCGTGRHTFKLAEYFSEIYAYDFSPKMIVQAKKEKKKRNISNVHFSVADIEYEELLNENAFVGKADLVVASFGMGSFVEDTSKSFRRFYEWLKPEGRLFVSFYNSASILLKVTPNWRDTSLSALIDVDNNTLEVQLNPELVFKIFCKPFNEDVEKDLDDIFEIQQNFTYPTTMALLPNSLLENNLVEELFLDIDKHLSSEGQYKNGHYVVIIAKKKTVKTSLDSSEAFTKIQSLLKESNAQYEVIPHELVLSISDVVRKIGYFKHSMIKTVILKLNKENKFVSVATLAEKKINIVEIVKFLKPKHDNITRSNITFASQSDIISIGFSPGGIAPFKIDTSGKIIYLIDEEIFMLESEWLYMGVGDNKKTLKIKTSDFQEIVSDFERIPI